jgi:hypothetical protein
MDTTQLRQAFTLSETVNERIRAFRQERVALVLKDETPVALDAGGRLLLHLVPVSSFRSRQQFAVGLQMATLFPPLGSIGRGHDRRLNLDGLVTFDIGANVSNGSYTQFFRNGVLEAVMSRVVSTNDSGQKMLPLGYIEQELLKTFPVYLESFKKVGVWPPIWAFLSVTGAKGAQIPSRHRDPVTVDRDLLLLPEFAIENLGAKPIDLLRPAFELLWNAAGSQRGP